MATIKTSRPVVMSPTVEGSRSGKGKAQPVTFTSQQIEWLEQTFPEHKISPGTTMEDIQFQAGRRDVVRAVRLRRRDAIAVELR
ncbi:hypothetical protein SPCB_033 [Pseudomonas phage vB_PaeP_SPCB]|uniref:Uncharacterized protein n=9 Tax=Phikmvvirus TaxID=477967 RepID=Q7Y2D8_BPKMV|nr:hypothetical protein phiKMVp27 [Pseudomonas phage phiKMV]YP_002117752.1 hypothetical protein HOS06_gp30 [Pseudomonas phage PT5]YP_006299951.1 hypothetical protein TM32_00027 [Pseudomonas phage vB_Pae-TbilisiM32]YP_009801285.1 hypothetical protein HOT21_gp27 [Pseudomonas phage vB_PaeP_PAO1_1-15pyo]QGF20400.1 hypothetical protein [Pseudomonas phage vB_PaeP_ASP23]QGJ86813.1 hypothetical protein SPCB_033 [Pseudomonas phage vB_PaeP_SPCB]QGJ86877.1 hypothetical protein SPCG_031 [Pseudomonas phag